MAEAYSLNCRNCGRLVCDVSDKDMLPDSIECQHCHHVNIIRRRPPMKKKVLAPSPVEPEPVEPEPLPVDLVP